MLLQDVFTKLNTKIFKSKTKMEEETTKEGGKEESIYINTKKGVLLNIGTKKNFF